AGHGEVDVGELDARGLRGDLPEHRLGALPDVRRRRSDEEPPAGAQIHGDLALQVTLPRTGEPGAVHEHGSADAARRSTFHDGPACALGEVVARRDRILEALHAGDAGAQELPRRRRVALPEDVVALELDRILAERARDAVEVALDGPYRLRRTEAAEGSVRRR